MRSYVGLFLLSCACGCHTTIDEEALSSQPQSLGPCEAAPLPEGDDVPTLVIPAQLTLLRESPGEETSARALGEFAEWRCAAQAPGIARLIVQWGSPATREALAEVVLRGDLDVPLPGLEMLLLRESFKGDPARQVRAIQRLEAGDDEVAEALTGLATGDYPALVRYEAVKRLDYAGRGGRVAPGVRAEVFKAYEEAVR